MNEQSKAAKRRIYDPAFTLRYFVGKGIDVGAGGDSLRQHQGIFPLIESIEDFDKAQGDAQTLSSVPDQSFEFLHASHILEHMEQPYEALVNWIRVVRSGGYLIITVPDEDMYEQGHWPSIYSNEHKHTFTMNKAKSWSPVSINLITMANWAMSIASTERLVYQREFYQPHLHTDQTMGPAECAIEWVLRRR
jgi:predicted SAM-dependent methyltransferase